MRISSAFTRFHEKCAMHSGSLQRDDVGLKHYVAQIKRQLGPLVAVHHAWLVLKV